MGIGLLVTVKETSVSFQSIPRERATAICLRPFCLSEMFNFLAHNGSCTLGKHPLLACLFGRRGLTVDLTWFPTINPVCQRDEGMRGRERGRMKNGIERKTQFIWSNWLHLSKHPLLAQWSSRPSPVPAMKRKISLHMFIRAGQKQRN